MDKDNSADIKEKILEELHREYARVMESIDKINLSFLNHTGLFFSGFLVGFSLIFSGSSFSDYLAIIMPFIMMYYSFNILKYTLKVLEYRGFALAIEEYVNRILGSKVLSENTLCTLNRGLKNLNPYMRGVYGALAQIAFIVPIGFFSMYFFRNALMNLNEMSEGVKVFIATCLGIALLVNLYLGILCVGMTRHTRDKVIKFWELDDLPDSHHN